MDPRVGAELQRGATRSVEETVRVEVAKSSSEAPTRGANRTGSVEGVAAAFAGGSETDATFAQFLPLPGLEWPSSAVTARERVQSRSVVGIFADIARAWVVVDNKIFLWNYLTGKEIVVHDKCAEAIVSVACAPPKSGVFQDYVRALLVIATTSTVHLVGAAFSGADMRVAELRLLDLAYAVRSPTVFTRVVVHDRSSRVFFGGLDGATYELLYTRKSSAYAPRMRLVNRSIFLGGVPVLNSLGKMISAVSQTWARAPPQPIRDMAVDQNRNRLYTLTDDSTVQLWSVADGDCRFLAEAKHRVDVLQSTLYNNAPTVLTPLLNIFPTHPQEGNFALVAIAENGDRYHFQATMQGWPAQSHSLVVHERIQCDDAGSGSGESLVGACYYADGVCVTSRNDGSDADDTVDLIATPRTMIPPHQGVRDVVTTVYAARGANTGAIEAIAEAALPSAAGAVSELCAQVFAPPRLLLLLHRRGLSLQIRLRPVDTLHIILSNPDAARREELLARFRGAYSVVDMCAMLVQLAVGNTHRDALQLDSLADGSPLGVMRRLSFSSPSKSATTVDAEQLASRVLAPVSKRVTAAALQALRGMSMPTIVDVSQGFGGSGAAAAHSGPQLGSGGGSSYMAGRSLQISLSPCVTALAVYFSRVVFPVWNEPLFIERGASVVRLTEEQLQFTDTSLSELSRLMQQLRENIWVESTYARNVEVQWEHQRVTVHLAGGEAHFSASEGTLLQGLWVRVMNELVAHALQVTAFCRHIRGVSSSILAEAIEDTSSRRVSFGDLCTKRDVGKKLARAVCRYTVNAQRSMKAAQLDASTKLLAAMERECPDLFTPVDSVECKAIAVLEKCERNASVLTRARLMDLMQELTPRAAALWTSGALKGICSSLVKLKCEPEAVALLLHAAAQADVPQAGLTAYLAQGGSAGAGDHSSFFTVNQTGAKELAEKRQLVDSVVLILETVWQSRRDAFDRIVGTASAGGLMWMYEPSDQLTHFLLLDWMSLPRADTSVSTLLDALLVASSSRFLEPYLQRNRDILGIQLGLYLRKRRHDYDGAIETYLHVARSPLRHVQPPSARLEMRIRCVDEAIDCARESDMGAAELLAMRHRLECQQALLRIVADYERSGDSMLDDVITIGEVRGRAAEFVQQHRLRLEAAVFDDRELFATAAYYNRVGGAHVQLDVLFSMQCQEQDTWADVLVVALTTHSGSFEENARNIISRFASSVAFPLTLVIKVLEAHYFATAPRGSGAAVELLELSGVDLHTVIAAYREIFARSVELPDYPQFAAVTGGYLLYSLAVAVHRLATFHPHASTVTGSLTSLLDLIAQVDAALATRPSTRASTIVDDGVEQEALAKANGLAHDIEQIVDGANHAADFYRGRGAPNSRFQRTY